MARPKRVEIDWEQFDKLVCIQATQEEVAGWFRCSEDTLERECKRKFKLGYAEYFKKKSPVGFLSLRRKIWQQALAGDKALLIFLSKQYLGFAEDPESRSTMRYANAKVVEQSHSATDLIRMLMERKANAIQIEESTRLPVCEEIEGPVCGQPEICTGYEFAGTQEFTGNKSSG